MTQELDDNTPAVPFLPFRCPRCRALKPRTYGQRGRVRYHLCAECKTRYRSVEVTSVEQAGEVGKNQ